MHVLPRRVLWDPVEGVVLADELATPVRLVVDRDSGWPILLGSRVILEAADACLWVPGDEPGSLQISGVFEDIDAARHRAILLWEMVHGPIQGHAGRDGERRDATAAMQLKVQWGKSAGRLHEAHEVAVPHPFARGEVAILRAANAQAELVDRLASALAGSVQTGARLVGVDEWGVTVRCRAGVLRASFDEPRLNEEDARVATVSLLNAQDF
jgi:hypothetical protein